MRIGRGYLIALAVVGVGGLITVLQGASSSGEDGYLKTEQAAQALARRHLPGAIATLKRLQIPGDFRPLQAGCRWYRCYVIQKPTAQTAAVLPMIMAQLGANNSQTRHLLASEQAVAAPLDRTANTLLKRLGVHGGPTKIAGCNSTYSPRHGEVVFCASPTVVDDNVVLVFLGPYFGCTPGPCRWSNETEFDISFPSGSSQAGTG